MLTTEEIKIAKKVVQVKEKEMRDHLNKVLIEQYQVDLTDFANALQERKALHQVDELVTYVVIYEIQESDVKRMIEDVAQYISHDCVCMIPENARRGY